MKVFLMSFGATTFAVNLMLYAWLRDLKYHGYVQLLLATIGLICLFIGTFKKWTNCK